MAGNGNNAGFEVLISSDSHVMEPPNTVKERVAPIVPRTSCLVFPKLQSGGKLSNSSGRVGPNLPDQGDGNRWAQRRGALSDQSAAALRDGRRKAARGLFPSLQRLVDRLL